MIEAVELSKHYGKIHAVKNIGLFIEEGELVGLLGPNGAGKSTTISMISSLVKPSGGDVIIDGHSVSRNPERIRPLLGVVPQEIALFMDLTARENLAFFGRAYKLSGERLRNRIDETLETIGLAGRSREPVSGFSGGMKRRLNIAVALLHQPRILIMDEPTVGIDPQSRNHILETVRRLNREQGMTVIYTSHYMEEVEFLCDRVYIMDHGDILANGSREELTGILTQEDTLHLTVDSFPERFKQALEGLESVHSLSLHEQTVTVVARRDKRLLESLFSMAHVHGVQLQGVQVVSPSLEDVFLHLTGRSLRD